MVKVIT